jgi:predicted membrane protein
MSQIIKIMHYFQKSKSVYVFLVGTSLLLIGMVMFPQFTVFGVSLMAIFVLWFSGTILLTIVSPYIIDRYNLRKARKKWKDI